jgi:hypothetical protein
MKKNSFSIVGILAVAFILALWFLRKPNEARIDKPVDVEKNSAANVSNSPPSTVDVTNTVEQDIMARYRQGVINKGQAIQETLINENKKPLDIYGKIVDQYGAPVSGAKVRGSIGLNVSFVKSGGEYHYTETDSDGRFQFLGIHGVGIGIWPQKEGYFYNLKQPSQRPDDYKPDPNNPIVFKMWKLNGAEPVVSSSIDAKIPYDGSTVVFDIATGKESPEGDFRLALSRTPLEVRRGRDRYNWTVKIEIAHGGFIEESDFYPYWAPESGYEPYLEFNISSNAVPWTYNLEKNFYIKNSKGLFGVMQLGVYPDLTPARLKVNFTVNPSGSQNLEPTISQ